MEVSPYSILILTAFGLLVTLSGGVVYLTLAEWRDRRRRDADTRTSKPAKRGR